MNEREAKDLVRKFERACAEHRAFPVIQEYTERYNLVLKELIEKLIRCETSVDD